MIQEDIPQPHSAHRCREQPRRHYPMEAIALKAVFSNHLTERDCARCKNRMDLVTTIQPLFGQPGPTAFLCSRCGRADSVLSATLSLDTSSR
jgi:hypothetical protein